MDLAPVIAMNFMRYKILYFFGLSKEKGPDSLDPPPGSATEIIFAILNHGFV